MYRTDETLWSQYEDLGLIGMGSYARVRRARHRLTGVIIAIKVLEKQHRFHRVAEEVEVMKKITHPNVVSLFQVIDTKQSICLVMELYQTELMWYVYRKGSLQEDEACKIFRQVLDAICYLHNQRIIHQDIKPDNIMLDARGKVRVIDFGLATKFVPGQMLTRYCGAYKYMSPEAILCKAYDGPKKDVWSLGVLLYFMVTGTIPFNSKVHLELKEKIVAGEYRVPEWFSEELKDLIRLLLSVDPRQRPTTMDIMNHPWLQQGQGGSESHGPLPRQVDTKILSLMEFMKFDVDDILESIQESKYDTIMATYLLLQYQAQRRMGDMAEDKPICPGTTPFPTPTDPTAFPLPPKRKHSVPISAFRTLSCHLTAQEQPEDGQQAEHKDFKSMSLPNLHLSCPKERSTVTPSCKCPRPVTAPGSFCPGPGPQLLEKASPQKEEQPASTWGFHAQGSCPKKMAISTEEIHDQESRLEILEKLEALENICISEEHPGTSNWGLRRRWKALRSRIQSCLRRLFHHRPPQNFHLFGKCVSPVQPMDSSEDNEAPDTLKDTDKIRPP